MTKDEAQAYFQAALHNAVFWQNKCVDLYEIIELFCLDAQATPQPQEPRNFCPRCGKRTADLTVIHTCTPPKGGHQ